MHIIQKRILRQAKKEDISSLGYRSLGEKIGVDHPQQVKWHLQKLIKDGHLKRTASGQLSTAESVGVQSLFNIPVLGRANCGEALAISEDADIESLTISKTLMPKKSSKLFAVQAVGESMNCAQVGGQSISDGDYVIVDGTVEVPKNGDYVVSSIEGLANIKRFKRDENAHLVALMSESTEARPPIILDEQDTQALQIHGVAVRVIKTGAF